MCKRDAIDERNGLVVKRSIDTEGACECCGSTATTAPRVLIVLLSPESEKGLGLFSLVVIISTVGDATNWDHQAPFQRSVRTRRKLMYDVE